MRKLRSFRIDESLLTQASKDGLDLTALIEAAIAKALGEKRCPYCRQKLVKKV